MTIVDDDIDVFDAIDVEWAVATRVQADRDVLIVSNARSKPLTHRCRLDPGKIPTTAKMGIDATIPDNVPASRYNRIVYYNQGKVQLNNYLGEVAKPAKERAEAKPGETVETLSEKILAVLKNSHCFFADLLDQFPQVEYRAIATAVGLLHQEGRITQDGEGKYQVKEQTG